MTDAITEEEYQSEVEKAAEYLADGAREMVERGDYDELRDAVLDLSHEEAENHNWFARSYYDGALYGSIVEHRQAATEGYADWMSLIETNDPMETLKRLAYVVFEADITDEALDLIEDE